MSGIEVAGLLLGIFPLIITGLEHYRETASVLGVFWKIRRKYLVWMHSVNICKLAFENNLEELLLPLIADDDQLKLLIADPQGPEWQNPQLEQCLRERLPKSYDLYLESISHIKETMDQLSHELGVDNSRFQSKVSLYGVGTPCALEPLSYRDSHCFLFSSLRMILIAIVE
jgi:hypothetical protein